MSRLVKLSRNIKLILLDRDGCINIKAPDGEYVSTLQNFKIYPDALVFIRACIKLGIHISVVTNQQGISKGAYEGADVEKIHQELIRVSSASIDQLTLFYCPHAKGACGCRKPKTGLLEEAIRRCRIERSQVLFIGDQLSDLEASRGANVNFIGLCRNDDINFPENTMIIRSFTELQFESHDKEIEN
jgi:D-glycero-D-manno-heptose 1,7-bisphosphate phosphatase